MEAASGIDGFPTKFSNRRKAPDWIRYVDGRRRNIISSNMGSYEQCEEDGRIIIHLPTTT